MKLACFFVSLLLTPVLFAQQDAEVAAAKTHATAQEQAIAQAQTAVHSAADEQLAYVVKNGTEMPPTAGGLTVLEVAQLNLLNVTLRFKPTDPAAIAAKNDWVADVKNRHPGFQVEESPAPAHLVLLPGNWN